MTQPATASRRATGWIVAGVAVLLLLGLAGVVTLVALDSGGSSEPEAHQPTTGSPTPSGDRFVPVPDLCEDDDIFAPVFDILPAVAVATDSELGEVGTLYQRGCIFRLNDESSLGHLRADIAIYESPERARNGFRGTSDAAGDFVETQEELDVDWDEAVVLLDETSRHATVQLVLMDGALLVDLWCEIRGDARDIDAQQAALSQVAQDLREAVRR